MTSALDFDTIFELDEEQQQDPDQDSPSPTTSIMDTELPPPPTVSTSLLEELTKEVRAITAKMEKMQTHTREFKPLSLHIEYIYIIQHINNPSLFRIGTLAYTHSSSASSLHRVFSVTPTLNIARDLKAVQEQFQAKRNHHGWHKVHDFEIRFYMDNTILTRFNREITQVYSKSPSSLPIPAADQMLIV